MQKSIAKDLVFMVWYHEYMDGFLNYLDTLMEREEIAQTPYGFVKVMQYVDFDGNNIEKYLFNTYGEAFTYQLYLNKHGNN